MDVLVSWTRITSVNLVRDYSFLIISLKIYEYELKYCWYAPIRHYQAHEYQLDFLNQLKNKFAIDPRHLRRIWDINTRVFDEAKPNLPGISFFGRYLESDFEKEVKMDHTKIYLADLYSACRELSKSGLKIVVALSVCWQFLCVRLHEVQSSCTLIVLKKWWLSRGLYLSMLPQHPHFLQK